MLLAILATCSPEELEDMDEDEDDVTVDLALPPSEVAARRQQIKNKILAVGKMQRVFQLLRCANIVWNCIIGWLCLHVVITWDVGLRGPSISAIVIVLRRGFMLGPSLLSKTGWLCTPCPPSFF